MKDRLYRIDNIYWMIDEYDNTAIPVCPKDYIKLTSVGVDDFFADKMSYGLKCEECGTVYNFNRTIYDEKEYVVEKLRALERKKYEIIDIDGIQTPVTKKVKINSSNKFFCTAQIRSSKRGPQVVIYAGEKGSKKKSQIFISGEERRLSFDQNDMNPTEVFSKITAEFYDGTKHTIEKGQVNDIENKNNGA